MFACTGTQFIRQGLCVSSHDNGANTSTNVMGLSGMNGALGLSTIAVTKHLVVLCKNAFVCSLPTAPSLQNEHHYD